MLKILSVGSTRWRFRLPGLTGCCFNQSSISYVGENGGYPTAATRLRAAQVQGLLGLEGRTIVVRLIDTSIFASRSC